MGLVTKVKAGSVTSLSDARYFAGMGVDWLGFDVNSQSDNFVSVELYENIAGWVSGPKRVIEFSSHPVDTSIREIVETYSPDFLQVSLNHVQLLSTGIALFAHAPIDSIDFGYLARVADKIEYLVVELAGKHPLSQRQLLSEIAVRVNVLLTIEPDLFDVKKIISELPISGFALKGSKELKTGLKDYDYSNLLESLDDGG